MLNKPCPELVSGLFQHLSNLKTCFNPHRFRNKFGMTVFILVLILFGIAVSQHRNIEPAAKPAVFCTMQLAVFEDYINKVISNFQGGSIKWVDVPYSEAEKRALASILTDNPPDLINLAPDFSMLLAQKKALEEIPAEMLKDYHLTEALQYNGKYYGIPFYASSAVTLYNKKLMPDLKKLPSAYDELLKIKPPKGAYISMITFSENDTLLKILNKYGINSPETINSEKSQELFRLFKYAYDNEYIPKESAVQTHREALEQYTAGKLVFLVTGANFLNMIKENAPDIYKNTIVLPQLTGTEGKYDFSLMNLVIPLKAAHKETALKFALYLTNEENQTAFSKRAAILPVNKKAVNENLYKNSDKDRLMQEAASISAKQLENILLPARNIKNKKDLNTLASNAVQEILTQNKDIKETLDKFKSEWHKLEDK